MDALIIAKQQIARFYARFEAFVVPVLKFLAMLFALIMINNNIGYMSKLKNPAIVLILSLLCSFLPANVIVLIAGLVIVAHVYSLSLECAVVVLFVFIIMFALYFRFTPRDAIAVILTPMAFALKMPYVMPLVMGFAGNPISCVSVGCGTVVYYIIQYVSDNETALSGKGTGGLDAEKALSGFKMVIDGLLKNNDAMIATIITFSVTLVVVYLIRRLSINYSWMIALGTGIVTCFIVLLITNSVLDADLSIGGALLGLIIAIPICLILQLFVFSVDYSRAEHVQFEDDDYYYYVKAIPKIEVEDRRSRSRRANNRNWEEDDEEDY